MPPSSKNRPTIDDVAAHSGVARVTVSRVLNGGAHVSERVRDRVQEAVRALGYKVNVQARSLAGGSSRQLTFVHESAFDAEPNSYYHSGLELGALRACADHGFMFSTFAVDPAARDTRNRLTELVEAGRTDGVVLTPPLSDDVALVEALMALGVPIICVSAGEAVRAVAASIGIDDEAAGFEIGAFLIDLGHTEIGYIDGPAGHMSAAQRLRGVKRAMSEAGVGLDHLHVERGDFTFRSGIVLAEKILVERPTLTALVCANDDMAAGAILTVHRKGWTIPGDLSITGFDDTPVSEIIWPPLTTVHQPIRRIGQRAVEMLIEAINAGGAQPRSGAFEAVPFQIVERASTGRPRSGRGPDA